MPSGDLSGGALRCDLLVFDLDGTLIDSQQDLADAVNAALEHLGRTSLDAEQVKSFIGDGAAALLNRALEATGENTPALSAQALSFFLSYYRAHNLDTTHTYPGVIAELDRIHAAAPWLPMAVLTNKPTGPSVAICDGLGLSRFFFANCGSDSFSTKKPDPLGMLTLMSRASALLGRQVDHRRTVLVGDSHVDVETARAAGTLCIGCSYGLSPESLLRAGPDAMVTNAGEWLQTLQALL